MWGTDNYTAESAVCVAAVHRGIISAGSGGTVSLRILGASRHMTAAAATV